MVSYICVHCRCLGSGFMCHYWDTGPLSEFKCSNTWKHCLIFPTLVRERSPGCEPHQDEVGAGPHDEGAARVSAAGVLAVVPGADGVGVVLPSHAGGTVGYASYTFLETRIKSRSSL